MEFITAYQTSITLILSVLILVKFGSPPLIEAAHGSKHPKFALWLIFSLHVIYGLMLGAGLFGVMRWLTGLSGTGGAIFASIGAIASMWVGWHAVKMLIEMIRDVADGQPDKEARAAALWVPTMLPAGFSSVRVLIEHPRSIGISLVAAILVAITIFYCTQINKAALKSKKHAVKAKWFATAVSFFAGIIMITGVAYLDSLGGKYLPGPIMGILRAVGGVVGLALLFRAIKDILDHVPDKHVRAFGMFGIPLLFLFVSLGAGIIAGGAADGLGILGGKG